jgi:HTH-type transcriptional regulator / antitoxin HipB
METVVRTPQQLSQTLRAQRSRKGLTQSLAGATVGLLPKTISALETRPEGSSIESLFRLLSALNLELLVREKSSSGHDRSHSEW